MPTWADDMSIMLPFCRADQVAPFLQRVTSSVEHHSRATGVHVNFDKGKTEALCFLRGQNSRTVRRELLQGETPTVTVELRNGNAVALRLVDSYVHLGSLLTHTGSPAADAKAKAHAASPTFDRLRKTLLRNPELLRREKVDLVRSLILAKVLYGAGLWNPCSTADANACRSAVARFWRFAFRPITGLSSIFLTDEEVCRSLGALSPCETLNAERVRQLAVVVQEGPSFLWDCLLVEASWLGLAFAALADVCRTLDFCFGRELPSDRSVCLAFLRSRAACLARLPGKYTKLVLTSARSEDVLEKATLATAREKEGWTPLTLPSAAQGCHACPICHATFSSKAAAASHQASRHGVSLLGTGVSGSTCHVCCQQWWTTFRLKEHLRRSEVCRNAWHGADLDPPLPFEHTGSRQNRAWRPPVPVAGPRPFWATLAPGPPHPEQQIAKPDRVPADLATLEAGPGGNLCSWFLRLYRLCQESSAENLTFTEGTLASDALRACQCLPTMDIGACTTFGNLCCLLEERHRLWLQVK